MTSTTTDELYIALHGEQGVAVFSPKGESLEKVIPMQFPGQIRLIRMDIGWMLEINIW